MGRSKHQKAKVPKPNQEANQEGPKIALFYIMYNEEKIISRHLQSLVPLVPLVEGMTVVTNGTDNTIPIMKQWCDDHRIPFVSLFNPFDDFGHQRQRSYDLSKKSFPRATHDMTLDADHCLVIRDRSHLLTELRGGGCILLRETFNRNEGWNRRIFARNHPFECWLRTHEIWITPDSTCRYIRASSCSIDDKSDGASHDVKYERDIRLLLLDHNENKESWNQYKRDTYHQRVSFYLAQSYYSLRQYTSAITYYHLRSTQEGFPEEVYIAYWKGGHSHEQLARIYRELLVNFNDGLTDQLNRKYQESGITITGLTYYDIFQQCTVHTREAIRLYQTATRYRPTRGEAIYDLVQWYRWLHQYHDALEWCEQGRALSKSEDSFLVNPLVYDYLFDIELRHLRDSTDDHVIRTIGDQADRRLRKRNL